MHQILKPLQKCQNITPAHPNPNLSIQFTKYNTYQQKQTKTKNATVLYKGLFSKHIYSCTEFIQTCYHTTTSTLFCFYGAICHLAAALGQVADASDIYNVDIY